MGPEVVEEEQAATASAPMNKVYESRAKTEKPKQQEQAESDDADEFMKKLMRAMRAFHVVIESVCCAGRTDAIQAYRLSPGRSRRRVVPRDTLKMRAT